MNQLSPRHATQKADNHAAECDLRAGSAQQRVNRVAMNTSAAESSESTFPAVPLRRSARLADAHVATAQTDDVETEVDDDKSFDA